MDGWRRGRGVRLVGGHFGGVMMISGQAIKSEKYVGEWLCVLENLQNQNGSETICMV